MNKATFNKCDWCCHAQRWMALWDDSSHPRTHSHHAVRSAPVACTHADKDCPPGRLQSEASEQIGHIVSEDEGVVRTHVLAVMRKHTCTQLGGTKEHLTGWN